MKILYVGSVVGSAMIAAVVHRMELDGVELHCLDAVEIEEGVIEHAPASFPVYGEMRVEIPGEVRYSPSRYNRRAIRKARNNWK